MFAGRGGFGTFRRFKVKDHLCMLLPSAEEATDDVRWHQVGRCYLPTFPFTLVGGRVARTLSLVLRELVPVLSPKMAAFDIDETLLTRVQPSDVQPVPCKQLCSLYRELV